MGKLYFINLFPINFKTYHYALLKRMKGIDYNYMIITQ